MKVGYIYAATLSAFSIAQAQTSGVSETTETSGTAEASVITDSTITPDTATLTTDTPALSETSAASDASATDVAGVTATDASLDTTVVDVTNTIVLVSEILTTITSTDSTDTVLITTTIPSTTSNVVITNTTSIANATIGTTTGNSSSTRSTASSATPITLPTSTDAAQYLSFAFPAAAPQPTWATGQYYTMLASVLYSVDRSFALRSDYQTIISAIESAADNAGSEVSASVEASAWGWGVVTTNAWYQTRVPEPLQTEVLDYNNAWHSAASSVQALATATGAQPSSTAAAAPRCTGMLFAGIAVGVAGAIVGAA
ncbi:hypothetical protein BKA67DRAFT_558811 [Truncatella angustata]|uniref:Uncharacterized protein n=1 Tax=Truncatella angustata TaxID=152316 RepID=A0A9P9A0R9_9PEZI|nr:uncharacterized protein BKA67DRAFT_558811 [Truncatella angustata]KAH6658712.1 hypothetical protein BKA67DRAFT_558811 [Truncatella angustata]